MLLLWAMGQKKAVQPQGLAPLAFLQQEALLGTPGDVVLVLETLLPMWVGRWEFQTLAVLLPELEPGFELVMPAAVPALVLPQAQHF